MTEEEEKKLKEHQKIYQTARKSNISFFVCYKNERKDFNF